MPFPVIIDPVGNRTSMAYDALNRLVENIDPRNKSATMAYDALNRLISSTDRLGQRRDYSFNAISQQTGEVWKDGGGSTVNTLTFTWDANGNRTLAADKNGAYTTTYDALDRATVVQGPFGLTLTQAYDAVGNRTRVEDSKGGVTTSVYNADNLLTQRQFGGVGQTPLRFDQTYTARDELAGVTRYSDLAGTTVVGTSSYVYDNVGNTTSIVHKDGSGTTLLALTYTYDLAHRLSTDNVDGALHTYTYDNTNQLTGDGTDTFAFDLNGNPTGGGFTVTTGNLLSSDGTWTYTNNDAGQRTKKSLGASAETWTYRYDTRGQMDSAEQRATDGGTLLLKLVFTYDVDGRLITQERWTSGSGTLTTRYGYDTTSNNVWVDLDGSNTLLTRYLRPDGMDALAARINAAGSASWHLTDRQGTILGNTNAAGALANKNVYNSYGKRISQSNAAASDAYGYTGKAYQADLQFSYHWHRWYDTISRRWTTFDPIGFQAGDFNLQRYVGNGPTNGTDPTGNYLVLSNDRELLTFFLANLTESGINWDHRFLRDGRSVIQLEGDEQVNVDKFIRAKGRSREKATGLDNGWIERVVRASYSKTDHLLLDETATWLENRLSKGEIDEIQALRGDLPPWPVRNDPVWFTDYVKPRVDGVNRTLTDLQMLFTLGATEDSQIWYGREWRSTTKIVGADWNRLTTDGWNYFTDYGPKETIRGLTKNSPVNTVPRDWRILTGNGSVEDKKWAREQGYEQGRIAPIILLEYGIGESLPQNGFRRPGFSRQKPVAPAAGKYVNCFPADTVVGTEHGPRPIQDVRADDRVWAFDLVAGEWKLRRVMETYRHNHDGDVVAATVAGEVIESTGHHPWWAVRGEGLGGRPQPEHVPGNPDGYDGGGRWVDAIDLRVGDVLLLRSGEQAAITALEIRHARLPVYNFQVEELHCYAVGHAQILVHNNSGTATAAEVRGWLRSEPPSALDPKALTDIKGKLAANDPYLWSDPIEVVVVNGKTHVLNGHHRLTAVVESGHTGNVPYRVVTEAEAKASYGFDAGNTFGTFGGGGKP